MLAVAPKLFWTLLDPFLRQLPAQIAGKLKDRLLLLLEGLNVLRRPALMCKILVVSVLIWILEATVYMICQEAFWYANSLFRPDLSYVRAHSRAYSPKRAGIYRGI